MSNKDLSCEIYQFEENYMFPLKEAVRKSCSLRPHQLDALFIYPEKNIKLRTFNNISHWLRSNELRLVKFGTMMVLFRKEIFTRLRTQTIFATAQNKQRQNFLVFPEVMASPDVVNNREGFNLEEGRRALHLFSRRLFEECLSNLGKREAQASGPVPYYVIPLF